MRDALDEALLDLHERQNRPPAGPQPWQRWGPAASAPDPTLAVRYVPPRPRFDPPIPEPVRYTAEQVEELLRLVNDGKVLCRCGSVTSLGTDPLARLRNDREAWRADTEEAMVRNWQTSEPVLAAAEAEQALARERAREIDQERRAVQQRQDRADRMFHDLIAAGEPIADARNKVVQAFPGLDW